MYSPQMIGDYMALADAILNRLVSNVHKIQLTVDSMRKVKTEQELVIESTES